MSITIRLKSINIYILYRASQISEKHILLFLIYSYLYIWTLNTQTGRRISNDFQKKKNTKKKNKKSGNKNLSMLRIFYSWLMLCCCSVVVWAYILCNKSKIWRLSSTRLDYCKITKKKKPKAMRAESCDGNKKILFMANKNEL